MDYPIIKYPRTPHLAGSRLQPGDEDLSQVPFSCLAGRRLTVEEKVDGANSAVSFGPEGQLLLQSRGHYLTGGWRERHYAGSGRPGADNFPGRRPTRARCARRSAAATSSTASGSMPSTAYITTRCPTTSLSSTSSTARRANFSTQGGAGS